MKLWEIAKELQWRTARIRNRKLSREERLPDLVALEGLLTDCAADERIGELTAGYRDTRREGILTYEIKAVEDFIGRMLYAYPEPKLAVLPVEGLSEVFA